MKIGVLALQGDFALHKKMLEKLGTEVILVKTPADLKQCNGLILPGGESTTFIKLLRETGLFNEIRDFTKKHQIFGTCAGLITLSSKVINSEIETLNLIDLTIERNAYGRQIDSFIEIIEIKLNGTKNQFEGVFIRAPKIREVGEGIKILGRKGDEIVIAENSNVLVSTFHPELTENPAIHLYFLQKIKSK